MQNYDWTSRIKPLYEAALERYREGHRDPATLFTDSEAAELEAIGARPMEMYDYAEDANAINWETALLIISVRRDYFLMVQNGKYSGKRLSIADFPRKDEQLDGIPWLPRLILKAKCRLKGELPRDLMYCCGGDLGFFRKHDLHPADFLRFVWAVDGDEGKILAYVRGKSAMANGNQL